MRRIRSKDTAPELLVRRTVHREGFRFRLHRVDLPGKPDLVLPRLRKVIFVHGCYWHQHRHCSDGRVPKSNRSYWMPKLLRNKRRDAANRRALTRSGWRSLVIWECETKDAERLARVLNKFLRAA